MKTQTIKAFIENSNINPRLIRAVINQLGGFESFKQSAPDISNHGINGGFSGFIYYSDTVPFAKKYKKEILELAEELADSIGEGNAFDLIAGFNCLKSDDITPSTVAAAIYQRNHEDQTTVLNALTWFAGEEVARAWCDFIEYE